MTPKIVAARLDHWIEFFNGEDYEGLSVAADLAAAVTILRRVDDLPHEAMCAVNSTCTCGAADQAGAET